MKITHDHPRACPDRASSYTPSIPGAPKTTITRWLHAHLDNGNDIFVGIDEDHPHGGPAIVHELRANQPDGPKSVLRFSLTPEACRALVELYGMHDVGSMKRDD